MFERFIGLILRKIGALLITFLTLFALTLVYLATRGLIVKAPSDRSETGLPEVTRIESPPGEIRPDPDPGTPSVSIERVSPFTAPEAQPLVESGDLLTRQLNEGIALNLEGDSSPRWEEILMNQIKQGQGLISLSSLHESFMSFSNDRAALAYAESYSATRYLIDRYGLYRIRELLTSLSVEPKFNKAFEDRFFSAYAEFERDWSRQVEKRSQEVP